MMTKTALLFAGQGAQEVGMGKDFCEHFPKARTLFESANRILGFDLQQTCITGPENELTLTANAQPAIFLVSWIAFQLLRDHLPESALHVDAMAGLSLGEITALAAAGTMSFEEGLRLVRARGEFMQEACEATQGGMAAIIGLDEPAVRLVCQETGVELANLNCPGQLVISGPAPLIDRACEMAKAKGALRAKPLAVAGAYHSRLMASAQPKLESALASIPLKIPSVPVISNVTAGPHGNPKDIHARLIEQVTAPVRWEQSMRFLIAQGFSRFIELGPGTTLSGFLKRIDSNVQRLHVSDSASLEATLGALKAA
jgi:[acyl-carrier-protein] S-malonyltransferase